VDGRANRTLVEALAASLGVKRSAVRIVTGASAKTKVVEVSGIDPATVERLFTV